MTIQNAPGLLVLGKLTFEPSDPPRPAGTYVLQRVKAGLGNVASDPTGTLQVRLHVLPVDARSPAQLARRDRVRHANAAWHALTPAEVAYWKKRGASRHITGYNAYVSAWLRGEIAAPPFSGAAHGMRDPGRAPAIFYPPIGAVHAHGIRSRMFASRPAYHDAFTAAWHASTLHAAPEAMPSPDRGTLHGHISVRRIQKT